MAQRTTKKSITARRRLGSWLNALFVVFVVVAMPMWGLYRWGSTLVGSDSRGLATVNAQQDTVLPSIAPFREPILSITFDDGWESVYTDAFPIMERYGIDSTQYVITNTFEKSAYMSVDQIRQMQQYGHQIASHTVSHRDLTQLPLGEMEDELINAKNRLTDLYGATLDFASPESSYDDDVLKAARKVYRSHRNTNVDLKTIGDADLNLKETFDPYNINGYSVRRTTTSEQIQAFIKAASAQNAWIVLVYHQIDDGEDYFGVTAQTFEAHMKLIKESGIKTVTVGDFMSALQKETRQ